MYRFMRAPNGATAADMKAAWQDFYADKPFVRVVDDVPATRHVRGSNYCLLAAFDDRIDGRVILFSTLDNLVKGSSGQAIQNMNLMFGFDETAGLQQQPLLSLGESHAIALFALHERPLSERKKDGSRISSHRQIATLCV